MTADLRPPEDWDDGSDDLAALFARTAPAAPPFDPSALRTSPARSRFRPHRSLIMKLSAAALAAAAAVLAAVWLNPTPAEAKVVTFEEVQEAVEAARYMTFTTLVSDGEGGWRPHGRSYFSDEPKAVRHEGAHGLVVILDLVRLRTLRFDTQSGSIGNRWAYPSGDLSKVWTAARFQELYDRRASAPEEVRLDGKELLKFEVPRDDDAAAPDRVWVDPLTKLPVRYERSVGERAIVHVDVAFPEELDADLFEASLPDAVLEDLVRDLPPELVQLDSAALGAAFGPPLTADGLGPLRFGMSAAEVEAATGIPCFSTGPGEFWFWLPSRGVSARGTTDDGLVQVYAGEPGAGRTTVRRPYRPRRYGGDERTAGRRTAGTVGLGGTQAAAGPMSPIIMKTVERG